jgi:hypothetical protein
MQEKTFSEFVRNGTPEEKENVFNEVIDESIKQQQSMQEKTLEETAEEIVNHFFDRGARVGTKDLLYIKMALEKAREEGRKGSAVMEEEYRKGIEDGITQYKEELKGFINQNNKEDARGDYIFTAELAYFLDNFYQK